MKMGFQVFRGWKDSLWLFLSQVEGLYVEFINRKGSYSWNIEKSCVITRLYVEVDSSENLDKWSHFFEKKHDSNKIAADDG